MAHGDAVSVLFVCTANRCRSPMAAALFRSYAPASIEVGSAGRLEPGHPASDGAVRTLAARGLDLAPHRSERLDPERAAEADLIVALAREHVRDVVVPAPPLFRRTFTLKELVRRGEAVGPRRADQPLAAWLELVGEGRRAADLLGDAPDDDVADPIGLPDREYERTAAELDALVRRLVALAFA